MKHEEFASPYSETIELEITSSAVSSRKVCFNSNTLPTGAVICGIELVLATRSQQDRTIDTNAYGNGAYLTLMEGNTARNKDISLNTLKFKANYGVVHALQPYVVNFQQSFISWPASTVLTAGNAIVLIFHYYPKEVWEKMKTQK